MAIKTIELRQQIDEKKRLLDELKTKSAGFATREAELETAINEASDDAQRETITADVESFNAEKTETTEQIEKLTREVAELENELATEEEQTRKTIEPKNNSRGVKMFNIRSIPTTTRALDAIPNDTREAIMNQDDTKEFLNQLRSMKGQNRAITGGELTIPVVFLDMIAENIYRYSKLLNRVRVREVNGEARQTIAGTVPEAIWTEMCANLNEITLQFNQITLDGYKVGGFIPVCNALLEDNDVNLAGWIIEMLSESIGYAIDKAILYGKGAAYHMPLGIATRLAQTSQPAGYPASAPTWTDLHTSNIISINGSLTGAAFWSALQVAAGNTFTKYSRGNQFWAMNSKTYALLKSKAITFTASGDVVANVYGMLPIVTGDIDILEFMPDNDIIGGYGDLYLWAQRSGMFIGQDEFGYTNRVKDQTLFFGRERADGAPVIAGAFVAININGSTPTTAMTFAADGANTVNGILLPSAATVVVSNEVQLAAVLTPFGVDGEITWASATTSKATVSSTGVVTGVSSGSSVITATCNGYTASCTVTVTTE